MPSRDVMLAIALVVATLLWFASTPLRKRFPRTYEVVAWLLPPTIVVAAVAFYDDYDPVGDSLVAMAIALAVVTTAAFLKARWDAWSANRSDR